MGVSCSKFGHSIAAQTLNFHGSILLKIGSLHDCANSELGSILLKVGSLHHCTNPELGSIMVMSALKYARITLNSCVSWTLDRVIDGDECLEVCQDYLELLCVSWTLDRVIDGDECLEVCQDYLKLLCVSWTLDRVIDDDECLEVCQDYLELLCVSWTLDRVIDGDECLEVCQDAWVTVAVFDDERFVVTLVALSLCIGELTPSTNCLRQPQN